MMKDCFFIVQVLDMAVIATLGRNGIQPTDIQYRPQWILLYNKMKNEYSDGQS
jgi:hypothetical protein